MALGSVCDMVDEILLGGDFVTKEILSGMAGPGISRRRSIVDTVETEKVMERTERERKYG